MWSLFSLDRPAYPRLPIGWSRILVVRFRRAVYADETIRLEWLVIKVRPNRRLGGHIAMVQAANFGRDDDSGHLCVKRTPVGQSKYGEPFRDKEIEKVVWGAPSEPPSAKTPGNGPAPSG